MDRQGVRDAEHRHAERLALWHWSTGDRIADVAESVGIGSPETLRILGSHGVLRQGGRDAAGGIAASMLMDVEPVRWTVADPGVVAVAVSPDERAAIAGGDMLHPDSDIQHDAGLTIPVLRALSLVLSPDLDDAGHWRAAGRLAHTVDGASSLVTTRRMDDGCIMASVHRIALAHGLVLLDVVPAAWSLSTDAGGTIEDHGTPAHRSAMERIVRIEAGRDAPDADDVAHEMERDAA